MRGSLSQGLQPRTAGSVVINRLKQFFIFSNFSRAKQSQVFHVGMMLALHGPSQFRNTIRRKNGIGDGAS
jgi:hypothetical protein